MVCIVNQRTVLCMLRLLLKGTFGEILSFNAEILIYLLESCIVFLIIFKFVSSSTIYSNYYLFIIATFRPEILYNIHICPRKKCISHNCSSFFLSKNIHNLQAKLISIIYNQINMSNNKKRKSTCTAPYTLL